MSINNKHYMRIDAQNRIIAGLTDDKIAYPGGVQVGDIFTHESGNRIFEMFADGEWLSNPPLENVDGVYLFKRVGNRNYHRTQDEIDADTPASADPRIAEIHTELDLLDQQAIRPMLDIRVAILREEEPNEVDVEKAKNISDRKRKLRQELRELQ